MNVTAFVAALIVTVGYYLYTVRRERQKAQPGQPPVARHTVEEGDSQ